jgi:ABC-type Fe3+-hydroxamate transport system substrate-binding protein
MKLVIDQMQQRLEVPKHPKRIISLVPSQTELLHYWGLGDRVVGITKFCVHPKDWYKSKNRIGGTKTVDLERIRALKPDLIIGNKEENTQSDIETLQKEYPVWMSDMQELEEVWTMMTSLGDLLNVEKESETLIKLLKEDFSLLKEAPEKSLRTAYFIWQNPFMVAGSNTFIDSLLRAAHFENVFAQEPRYPAVTIPEIQAKDPELILLSSEPYPFKEKHVQAFQEMCPNATIEVVDGELFSWYGSRLLHTTNYIKKLHQKLGVKK